jgi:hypothetical protein
MIDQKTLSGSIDELIAYSRTPVEGHANERASELVQGTLTLMGMVYGTGSSQAKALNEAIASVHKETLGVRLPQNIIEAARGALSALKRAVDAGLVGNLEREVAGEVLSDFLLLARTALDVNTEPSKNVAAVLAAAAFEDTIRRMGSLFCGIRTREDLQKIVIALKDKEILKGAQFGVVNAHLQFRNDSLHANWDKVERTTVSTALQLVQELLLKHFA